MFTELAAVQWCRDQFSVFWAFVNGRTLLGERENGGENDCLLKEIKIPTLLPLTSCLRSFAVLKIAESS